MDALGTFLAGTVGRPMIYGEWDCLLRLAEWGRVRSGRDAGQGWRGRCRTALGAARVLRRNGGVARVVRTAFTAIGWRETGSAGRGAVAVVRAPEGETGAILLGPLRDGLATVSQLAVNGKVIVRRLPVLVAFDAA